MIGAGRWERARLAAALGLAAALLSAVGPARAEAPAPAAAPVRWTLQDVVATALAKHPAVGQADAESRAAAARQGQAASGLYPQVGAQGAYTWGEAPSASTSVVRTQVGLAQGTVTQLLTDFGRTGAGIARAADLAEAAVEVGRSSRVEVAYAAAVAYFNALRADNLLAVARETVRQREGLLKQARAFYETGLKARIDVVRAEASLFQARADVTGAELDLQTSRLTLLARMGVDGPRDFALAEAPATPVVPGDQEAWVRQAEEAHPDLRALRLQVASAREALRAAGGASLPTLSASGRYGWTWGEQPAHQPLDRTWSLGVQVSVPVFTGYLVQHQVAEADARLASASFALEDRRRQVLVQVQQAAQAVAATEERLHAREKEREAFAENLRLATGRYEAGAGDIIEMTDAQVQMAQADNNLVAARFDRSVAAALLARAIGLLPGQ